jgi:hypothetical protein
MLTIIAIIIIVITGVGIKQVDGARLGCTEEVIRSKETETNCRMEKMKFTLSGVHNLHYSPNIIKANKLRRMRRTEFKHA